MDIHVLQNTKNGEISAFLNIFLHKWIFNECGYHEISVLVWEFYKETKRWA